jgi:hypothetical protein
VPIIEFIFIGNEEIFMPFVRYVGFGGRDFKTIALAKASGGSIDVHIECEQNPKMPFLIFDLKCTKLVPVETPTYDGARTVVTYSIDSPFGAYSKQVRVRENESEIREAFRRAELTCNPPTETQSNFSKRVNRVLRCLTRNSL